jgi:hypothetical protein
VHNRVEQLEQSLEGIVSLFARNEYNANQIENTDTSRSAPSISTASPATGCATLAGSDSQGDLFERGLITVGDAASLCASYRRMSEQHFSYVILNEDYEISRLRIENPLLLQAIITTASWQNRTLQMVLENELVRNLALCFFVRGENTIDILQAILVYLGWYVFTHLHFLMLSDLI